MDWREVGQHVLEDCIKAELAAGERAKAKAAKAAREPKRAEFELGSALIFCAQGNTEPLIDFLLSDKDFTMTETTREHLARILRHKSWVPRTGRRPDNLARHACSYAQNIFTVWKRRNLQHGISDWGVRDQMKDEACRCAIGLMRPHFDEPNFETVRQLMDRPKKRQRRKALPPPKHRQKRRGVSA